MVAERLTLQMGKRGFKTVADDAIKNDFMKGLVELITNSDDSYCNIERDGATAAGRIEISLIRRTMTDQSVLRIKDLAEGMDEARMKEAIGKYGEETSGEMGRGVFGMGLKDTINAFGEGSVSSIKDGRLYRCVLRDYTELSVYPARVIRGKDRDVLGVPVNGTLVEIRITNPKVRVPQFETLKRDTQTHVCLRGILSDPRRTIVLKDKGDRDHTLRYEVPENRVICEKQLTIKGFESVTARLTIRQATTMEPLTQSGSCRTGGILIMSKRAVHQATLFGFDDEPYAERLFGELICDELYKLQRRGEMVVTRMRDGLELLHPFSKALWAAAKAEVSEELKQIKEETEKNKRALEDAETRKRFAKAVQDLNAIAVKQLGQIGEAAGFGQALPPPAVRVPADGFEFIPDDCAILLGTSEKLRLRIVPDGKANVGEMIQLMTDSPGIRVVTANALVPPAGKEGLCTVEIEVEGIQHGAQGFVTARCGPKTAVASVEVVSERRERTPAKKGGLFKGIRFVERDEPRRAWFESSTGYIIVNTKSPCIQLFFGPLGEGQDQPLNQAIVAELVTEVAANQIGREKRRNKTLVVPSGVDELEFFYRYTTELRDAHSVAIYKALVREEFMRT